MWSRRRNKWVLLATGTAIISILAPQYLVSHETLTTTVLFDREIVRILNGHCVMCHVENGPSFPLATYEQTWVQARKIRVEAIARHMPPWSAFPGYGQFANDNSLTLREMQFIVSWVEGSGPRNAGRVFTNVADPNAPRPAQVRAQPDFDHWHLGEPELKRQLPANVIEADQGDTVRQAVVDLGLPSDRLISGMEFKPGDRRVVRAASFRVQETGEWLGNWTPWYGFIRLPEGVAWRIPAGAHIIAEIHYHGARERIVDQGTLGLHFAGSARAGTVSNTILEAKQDVPAGVPHQRFRASTRLQVSESIVALWPEVVPGIESIEVSARKPDGTTEVLLFAKNIRLDWPAPYIFKDPVTLANGTQLSVTAYYANAGPAPQPGGIRLTVLSYPAASGRVSESKPALRSRH